MLAEGVLVSQFPYGQLGQRSHYSDYTTNWATKGSTPSSVKIFFHFQNTQTISGVHPAFYSVGIRVLLPGVQQLGHDDDHSPPLSDKKKLCGLSPQANYTDRAAAAGRRS